MPIISLVVHYFATAAMVWMFFILIAFAGITWTPYQTSPWAIITALWLLVAYIKLFVVTGSEVPEKKEEK